MKKNMTNILYIDDDEEDFLITRKLISDINYGDYKIQWVSTYEKALIEIQKDIYDVFLIDYNLGGKTGLDLISESIEMNRNTPVIILTGMDSRDVDIMAMQKGVSDYLRKEKIDSESLERSIRYAIDKKRTENQILFLAYYDQITSLPNRVFFKEQLNYALAHAIRYGRIMAVLFLDIDNFKLVNDSLGHHVGDLLLVQVAKRLYSCIRKSDIIARNELKTLIDTVARLGGDEFTISLTEINTYDNASMVAERIIQSLNQPFLIEGHEIYSGASIGISLYPADSDDASLLLKFADNAMYHAKKKGKNRFQYYQKTMNDEVIDKMHLINNLRKAGERNEFLLYYQPKMDIRSGSLTGFEALIRWNKSDKGMVMPGDFIPFAEEHNLIGFITDWVIDEACRQLCEWKGAHPNVLPLSINLPINELEKTNFPGTIKSIIDSYGISPEWLELEVTESVFMDDTKVPFSNLAALQSMGFQISIDDFGTGFSSLSRLKKMPCDMLKIDRSFVIHLGEEPMDSVIVNSIIALGHGMNKTILAEGVETAGQLQFLIDNNCDFIQGYFLSRPVPHEKIKAILEQEARGEGIGVQLIKKITGGL